MTLQGGHFSGQSPLVGTTSTLEGALGDMAGKTYYTAEELAERLQVSVKTIYRMVERQDFKPEDYYKIGRAFRFFKKPIDERFRLED